MPFLIKLLVLPITCVTVLAQWVPTDGPAGGSTFCVLNHLDTLYAGTVAGDVFVSASDGDYWTWLGKVPTVVVISLYRNGKEMLAGTMTDGIFRSTDGGHEWSSVPDANSEYFVYDIESLNDQIFAGMRGKVLRTQTGNAENWQNCFSGFSSAAVDVGDIWIVNNKVYIATGEGVFVSEDVGDTWIRVFAPPIRVGLSVDTTLYCFAGGSVFVSSNEGISWDTMSVPVAAVGATAFGSDLVVASRNDGIYSSVDRGATWKMLDTSFRSSKITDITVRGSSLYVTTEFAGVHFSSNGGETWSPFNNGLTGTTVQDFHVVQGGMLAAARDGGLRIYEKGGVWGQQLFPSSLSTMSLTGVLTSGSNLVVSSLKGVFYSSDMGVTWGSALMTPPTDPVIALADDGTYLYMGAQSDVYRSSDHGQTWLPCDPSSPRYVIDIVAEPNKLFALSLRDGVFFSTDHGDSWTQFETVSDASYYCLELANDSLFVGTSSGLFVVRDQRLSLIEMFGVAVRDVMHHRSNRFIASDSGVYANGQRISEGIENRRPVALEVFDNSLYCSVYGRGVWKRPLSEIVSSVSETNTVYSPVAPTPTHGSSIVRFADSQLPRIVTIIDITGQICSREYTTSEFVSVQQLPVGTYSVIVNEGSDMIIKSIVVTR